MRYIADSDGYVKEVSFGADIACEGETCTEYTGSVPTGYASLEAWFCSEVEKLYRWKIVDGQLTLDSTAVAPVDGNDSGWVDITPSKGTWNYLKYRKIGSEVTIRGHATAFTHSGSTGDAFAKLPSVVTPATNKITWGASTGKRITKVGANTSGNLFVDYVMSVNDGSVITSSVWVIFDLSYSLDF